MKQERKIKRYAFWSFVSFFVETLFSLLLCIA